MKKTLIALSLFALTSVTQAANIQLSVGRDTTFKTDVAVASIGTNVGGFGVSGEVARAGGGYFYTGYGVKARKDISVGSVTVAPILGYQYIDSQSALISEGSVGTVGLGASLQLNKAVALTSDFNRRFDFDNTKNLQGNIWTVGIRGLF